MPPANPARPTGKQLAWSKLWSSGRCCCSQAWQIDRSFQNPRLNTGLTYYNFPDFVKKIMTSLVLKPRGACIAILWWNVWHSSFCRHSWWTQNSWCWKNRVWTSSWFSSRYQVALAHQGWTPALSLPSVAKSHHWWSQCGGWPRVSPIGAGGCVYLDISYIYI